MATGYTPNVDIPYPADGSESTRLWEHFGNVAQGVDELYTRAWAKRGDFTTNTETGMQPLPMDFQQGSQLAAAGTDSAGTPGIRVDKPGIYKCGFAARVTGPSATEFNFSAVVAPSIDPTGSDYGSFVGIGQRSGRYYGEWLCPCDEGDVITASVDGYTFQIHIYVAYLTVQWFMPPMS